LSGLAISFSPPFDSFKSAIRGGSGVATGGADIDFVSASAFSPLDSSIVSAATTPTPNSATMPKLAMIARGLAASSTVLGSVS
jgi:hypothetical protein